MKEKRASTPARMYLALRSYDGSHLPVDHEIRALARAHLSLTYNWVPIDVTRRLHYGGTESDRLTNCMKRGRIYLE